MNFDPEFTSDPVMTYGIVSFDINFQENPRIVVDLLMLNRSMARIRMDKVHDTKLYGVGISWMACDSV